MAFTATTKDNRVNRPTRSPRLDTFIYRDVSFDIEKSDEQIQFDSDVIAILFPARRR